MTLHCEELPETPRCEAIEVAVDDGRRLIVEEWENGNRVHFVTVAPQYRDGNGRWRLSHSGLILAPDVARELAPALLTVAAAIEAGEGTEQ